MFQTKTWNNLAAYLQLLHTYRAEWRILGALRAGMVLPTLTMHADGKIERLSREFRETY